MNSNLSLLKIINGLSKTLKIANQMLPLYNQIKPIITNGNEVINNISKNFQNNTLPSKSIQPQKTNQTRSQINNNLPTFFQ